MYMYMYVSGKSKDTGALRCLCGPPFGIKVLALQRLYLFSDNSDVDPADACDLKDANIIEDVSGFL